MLKGDLADIVWTDGKKLKMLICLCYMQSISQYLNYHLYELVMYEFLSLLNQVLVCRRRKFGISGQSVAYLMSVASVIPLFIRIERGMRYRKKSWRKTKICHRCMGFEPRTHWKTHVRSRPRLLSYRRSLRAFNHKPSKIINNSRSKYKKIQYRGEHLEIGGRHY